jgi:uncharacterized membrane protein YeaQ/YmgE (transglycosylase-associated protein family)
MIELIIMHISGAVGGNIAGVAMSEQNLGTLYNSVAGMAAAALFAGLCIQY